MSKKTAIMIILLGGTFMSFVGLYMRLLTTADGFQILFYRSIGLTLIVLLVVCIRRNSGPYNFIKSIDLNDLLMGV